MVPIELDLEQIARWIEQEGLSKAEIARRLGCSREYIRRVVKPLGLQCRPIREERAAALAALVPRRLTSRELKAWRTRMGLTQEELARLLALGGRGGGVTIARWETGETDVPANLELSLETIERRLKGLGD